MKKVTNVSLAGLAYAIEEDAYTVLAAYLGAIHAHFATDEDGAEICADIERGIGEKLSQKLGGPGRVVTRGMVEEVQKEMGRVEDITGEAAGTSASGAEDTLGAPHAKKKLFRDRTQAILGGVAAGIANYLDIDVTLVRLAFVIATFINGFGVLAYLLLWLLVPRAETTSEQYQMHGEPLTLARIANKVEEGVQAIRATDRTRFEHIWARVAAVLDRLFRMFGHIIRAVLGALRYVLGFLLILAGALALAGLTSAVSLALFSPDVGMVDPTLYTLVTALSASTPGLVLLCAGVVTALVPILVSIIAGASLLTWRNHFNTGTVLTLGVSWIIAVSVAVSLALVLGPQLLDILEETERVNPDAEQFVHVGFHV